MFDLSRSMRASSRPGALALFAAVAILGAGASGCNVVHGTGELLGMSCEWVDWQYMDPSAPSAPRSKGAGPEDETCYLAWPEYHARVALASQGEDADAVSCEERKDAKPSAEEPLVVRPGQIAWIYSPYNHEPEITLLVTTCAKLDAWTDVGGTPGEYAAEVLDEAGQ
jgi:hypothetical protein